MTAAYAEPSWTSRISSALYLHPKLLLMLLLAPPLLWQSFVVVVSSGVENRAALVVVGMDSPDDVLRLSSIPDWIDMSLPMLIRVVGSVVESSLIPHS